LNGAQYSVFLPAPPAPDIAKNAIVCSMSFTNPSNEEICKLLREVHTIAVVGLSPNTSRPSFGVARALQSFGYRIIPVRPLTAEVLGEKAYSDLESLPELPDIVEVFRASEHVPAIVDSCIKLGIKNLWLQDGVVHEEAALHARQAGIIVVMNRCMFRDHSQLCKDSV
jgi:predicted CoA-binding protein